MKTAPARSISTKRTVPDELRGATLAQGARIFRLVLVASKGAVPATVRLRRALKALLRVYRLRCSSVEEL